MPNAFKNLLKTVSTCQMLLEISQPFSLALVVHRFLQNYLVLKIIDFLTQV